MDREHVEPPTEEVSDLDEKLAEWADKARRRPDGAQILRSALAAEDQPNLTEN